jgi:GPH family glycoside/pentoside/hexuronide:cation symporter
MKRKTPSTSLEPSTWRLIVFASGDFGFNLYWQSASLYLLFYYTEVAGLSVLAAVTIYFAASIWDGVISLIVGLLIDRYADAAVLKRMLVWGAAALGVCFVLAYVDWSAMLPSRAALFLIMHILFRTAYAAVNLPYLSLSARISRARAAQSLLSGLRMLAGIVAAVLVADFTVPLGHWLAHGNQMYSYVSAAAFFGLLATLMIILVGFTYKAGVPLPPKSQVKVTRALRGAFSNRAFVIFIGAMMAMTVASSTLEKMVLYYFKYNLHNETAGQHALTYMVAASALAIPLWVILCRFVGAAVVWLVASVMSTLMLLGLAVFGVSHAVTLQIDLVVLQCAGSGLNFGLWAMLPEVLDYGMQRSGIWQEGVVYGLNALMQRIALGLGTFVMGVSMHSVGFKTNTPLAAVERLGLEHIFFILPAAFFGLSALLMAFSPLVMRRTASALGS